MIYSSACHLVTRFTRLPTLALPATAPSFGSSNQRARRAIVVGSNCVSASSAMDDLALRLRQCGVERTRLAAVFQRQQANARIVAERLRHDGGGAILRPVVDHDHLDRDIGGGEHAADRAFDHALFVVRRDHHRHEARRVDRGEHLASLAPRLDQRQGRQRERAQDADGDRDREHPVQRDDDEAQGAETAEVDTRGELVAGADRRHRRVARQAGEGRDGHEVIAHRPQRSMITGSAATVSARLPPASCSRITLRLQSTGESLVQIGGTIRDARDRAVDDRLHAGRFQSSGSTCRPDVT